MSSSTDNTLVNLQEEYENRQIQEVLDELEADLVGLKPVKDRIKEIAALLLVHRLRKLLGLTSANPNLQFSLSAHTCIFYIYIYFFLRLTSYFQH